MTDAPNKPSSQGQMSQQELDSEKGRRSSPPYSRRLFIRLFIAADVALIILAICLSALPSTMAQGDPTQALIQTLSSGVRQQFTLTAQGVIPITLTAMNLPTLTPSPTPNATEQRQTLGAVVNNQLTLTYTAVVQSTISARINELMTATAQRALSLTPSPTLNATQQQETVDALAGGRLNQVATDMVQTAVNDRVNQLLTATAQTNMTLSPAPPVNATGQQQTMNALVATRFPQAATGVVQTAVNAQVNNMLTATALSAPTVSPTPPNPAEMAQTQSFVVSANLTQTAQAQVTQSFGAAVQGTVMAINGPNMTATAQSLAGNSLSQQATLGAYLNDRMTQTAQFQVLQTVVADNKPTSQALFNQQATATAQAVRTDLATGLAPITAANAKQIEQLAALNGHTGNIRAITFNPLGTEFASASDDNTIRIWDVKAQLQTLLLNGVSDRVSAAFSPDGNSLVAGSSDGTVRVWDTQAGTELLTLKGHRGKVTSVAFSPDGKHLASGGSDRTIIIWDAKTGSQLLTFFGHVDIVTSLAFSPDGIRLISGGNDNTLRVWEVTTGFLLGTYADASHITSVAFSPDGASIATANQNGIIQVRSAASGVVQAVLKGHTGAVSDVAFSPNGKLLISAGNDETIRVWDIGTKAQVAQLAPHNGPVTAVAFSPDGAHLVCAANDNVLRLWGIRAAS